MTFSGEIEMQNHQTGSTDRLIRNERRGVWMALLVVMALGATLLLGSDTRRGLLIGLAVAIVFAVAWVGQTARCDRHAGIAQSREAVMHDELRAAALASAYKGAFFTVIGAQAFFCVLSTVIAVSLSAAMVCALTIVLGASLFLALFLFLDRV